MSLPTRPCGTPQELLEIGINPGVVPSCAPHDGANMEGCTMWRFCHCKDKQGKSIKGTTGPVYYGVRIAKPVIGRGVGRNQEIMACHVYVQNRHQIRLNGGICQIVAYEGDELELRGSKKVAPDLSAGAEPGAWTWKTSTYKAVVPKHLRPRDLPELMDLAFLNRERAAEESAEEIADARFLGVEGKSADAAADRK